MKTSKQIEKQRSRIADAIGYRLLTPSSVAYTADRFSVA